MKKRGFKILLIVVLIVLAFLLFAKWYFREAFGPKYRTVEIELNSDRKLVCKETYMADLHNVFYDVEFILKERDKEDINLGRTNSLHENWEKDIKLIEWKDWIILPVVDYSYSKVLINNDKLNISNDTIFSPLELGKDKAWKEKYGENPAWCYTGESRIDSIVNNRFYVNYEYRMGINEPYEYYNQTVEYEMDSLTGQFTTKTILERIKQK